MDLNKLIQWPASVIDDVDLRNNFIAAQMRDLETKRKYAEKVIGTSAAAKEVRVLLEKKYANIMLLGRTGVGKSSFINYLIGKEVSKVGIGMPITQGFNVYQYDSISGTPLQIFDSKGLEVMDYKTIKKDIFDFVGKRCGSQDVHEF